MLCYVMLFSSRDITVGIVIPGYELENPGFDSGKGQYIYIYIYIFWGVRAGSEALPASYCMDTEGSSPVMRDRGVNLTTHLYVVSN